MRLEDPKPPATTDQIPGFCLKKYQVGATIIGDRINNNPLEIEEFVQSDLKSDVDVRRSYWATHPATITHN